MQIVMYRGEKEKYDLGFYHPGSGRPIKVNKRIRHIWKICRNIRIASWIVVPCLLALAPILLIPWALIYLLTIFIDSDAEFVKAQENGYIWPKKYGGF